MLRHPCVCDEAIEMPFLLVYLFNSIVNAFLIGYVGLDELETLLLLPKLFKVRSRLIDVQGIDRLS